MNRNCSAFLKLLRKTLLVVLFFSSVMTMAATTSLKIQEVIQMALTQGLYQKDINLSYQKAEISRFLSEANFDTQMTARVQNEDSRAEAPGAFANDRDITRSWLLGVSRKFSTGTTLGLDYSYLHRESELSTFMQTMNASPIQYYHLTTLNFKQDLLNNSFGYRDRRTLFAAQSLFERAHLERDEASEDLVLQAIKLYLDAYFAQENLKQSLAARDKYLLLLKSVQQKNRMGFDDRSDLPKTKAELQNQERNVKSASLNYLSLIEKLYTVLNVPAPEEVIIDVPEAIPSPANVSPSPALDKLRKSQSMDLLVQATEAEREAASNNQWASLNFFAQAAYSGLDKSNSTALSEMNDRTNPKYIVGLELLMKWGGSSQKAENLSRMVAHEEALNNQKKVHNDLTETLERTQRNLQSRYIIAIHAQETVKIWEDAMKSQERNHRFGRITTSELILDYTSYFRAKSSLSGAIADYQMSLYEYQAARDELIVSKN